MRIVNMALAAALSVLAIASCGTRTGKKTTSEPAAETKAAQETETCITAIDKYLSEVQGDGRFHMTQEHMSPRYTTRWTELPKVSVK